MSTKGTAITKRCDSTCRHTASVESFALNHRLNTRTSDDGTRVIVGRYGHVFQFDDHLLGVIVTPNPPRKRYWGCVRALLLEAGMTLVQDGDGEGSAVFDPDNPTQAKQAIRAAGIKRKRQLSPAQREQRTAFLRAAQEWGIAAHERVVSPGD